MRAFIKGGGTKGRVSLHAVCLTLACGHHNPWRAATRFCLKTGGRVVVMVSWAVVASVAVGVARRGAIVRPSWLGGRCSKRRAGEWAALVVSRYVRHAACGGSVR